MKFVPTALTKTVGRTILKTQKHSPTLLFGAGVVGVVATTVLACRATLKLQAVLEEAQSDLEQIKEVESDKYSEADRTQDRTVVQIRTALTITKLYGPAVAMGIVSIGCLGGSHHILTKRNAGLMAAYASIEKAFSEYRQRVLDEVGEDKELEFRYGTEVVAEEGAKGKTVKRVSPGTPSMYARFFDECSRSWSRQAEYNLLFLRCQQNYANDLLLSRGHVFLNEIYDMLGIDRSKAGAVVGWVVSDGDNFIDFGVFDGNNPMARDFVNGREGSILLDFNVDGVIYDKI